MLCFEAACRDAGAARRAARWQEASAAPPRAVELWRMHPVAGRASQVLRDQFVPRDRADAPAGGGGPHRGGSTAGPPDRLIPELRDLAARHPVRERFHGQLMEALARAGRRRPRKGRRADRRPGPSLLTITPVIEHRWRWHILADPDGNEFVSCCPSAAPVRDGGADRISKVGQYPAHFRPGSTGIGCSRCSRRLRVSAGRQAGHSPWPG